MYLKMDICGVWIPDVSMKYPFGLLKVSEKISKNQICSSGFNRTFVFKNQVIFTLLTL